MGFNLDYLLATLPIMGKGMVGIFVVTAIIIGTVTALNYLTSRKDK